MSRFWIQTMNELAKDALCEMAWHIEKGHSVINSLNYALREIEDSTARLCRIEKELEMDQRTYAKIFNPEGK